MAFDAAVGNTYLGYTSSGPGQNMYLLSQGGGVLSAPSYRDQLVDTSPFAPAICTPNNGSTMPFLAWTATNAAHNIVFADYDSMPKIYVNGNG